MTDRLIEILKTFNLSAAQLAEQIGVQRSGISHIMSGRNRPSLDFIQKLLTRYPEINPNWLLFGKGELLKSVNNLKSIREKNPDLFTDWGDSEHKRIVAEVKSVTRDEFTEVAEEKPEQQPLLSDDRRIDTVIVFYTDMTCRTYRNQK